MKAMIFAAGLGTRLKPLTDRMPKALVPVGGKPLLAHVIEKMKASGFDEIIINLHHFADQIIQYIEMNHRFGIRIEFSDERGALLDTGGAIKKAAHFFDDGKPFLVHNVDILSNINLRTLYDSASDLSKEMAIATLACGMRETSRYFLFDNHHRLCGWINEKTGEVKSPFSNFTPPIYRKLAFTGIHILHPSLFQYMDSFPDRFSIIDFYLSICDKEALVCHTPENLKLLDVGKIEALTDAAQFLKTVPF